MPGRAATSPLKTFVLGCGAQKGGTTWLASYLHGHPQFAKGYQKEYHVFDSIDLGHDQFARRKIMARAQQGLLQIERGRTGNASVFHRLAMIDRDDVYFDHFAQLLANRPQARATGEFTPQYALLSTDRLEGIRTRFSERGMHVVPVFLMRDPVDRALSQVRMQIDRGTLPAGTSPVGHLLEHRRDPRYWSLSDYRVTVSNLWQVFGRAGVHLEFYETLFTAGALDAITDALGLDHHAGDFERRYNATTRPGADTPAQRDMLITIAREYAASYEFVARSFPDRDVASLWPMSGVTG